MNLLRWYLLSVSREGREYHGALKDADILAEVYLAMTRNQYEWGFQERSTETSSVPNQFLKGFDYSYPLSDDQFEEHLMWLKNHPNHLFLDQWRHCESWLQ